MSETPNAPVTLMYAGWLVWDGQFGPVRVGGDLVASVEFDQRSELGMIEADSPPQLVHLGENRYLATAQVLDATDAVVLDLGALRALRWVRPGESPGDFRTGTTVSLELTLNLNAWQGDPWTDRVAALYGTDHRWHVQRIIRKTTGRDDAQEIDEADPDTVESSGQYCLLECTLID